MLRKSDFVDPSHWVTCDQGHAHWGRNGVAGMLLRHQDPHTGIARYFLQQRGPDVQHPGTWSTPGGAIEDGETPHAAAMREAMEELGDFPAYNLRHMHTLDHGGWAYHTVTADVPHPFYPHGSGWDPNETSDAGWFTPHEIDELPLHPGFREGWDQYKPNQQPDPHREIWSKAAASTLSWQLGQYGKGLVTPSGSVYKWAVPEKDGLPAHYEMVARMGYDKNPNLAAQVHYFAMNPDGELRYVANDEGEYSGPQVTQKVLDSHPDLRPPRYLNDRLVIGSEKSSWWRWVGPQKPNPIDLLNSPADEAHPLSGGPNWYWIPEGEEEHMWNRPVEMDPRQLADRVPPRAATQFVPQLPEQEGKSTEPQEVANPEDHWPEFGERPPDWPSGTGTDFDWAITRV